MLFNSLEFLVFLPIVFSVYWMLQKNHTAQNLLIVVASYVFYGWWDWRFLLLIAFTSGWSYVFGILEKRKVWLVLSLIVNLGILGIFKYYNFFIESFQQALESIGISHEVYFLNVALPVGISFYTFQALSYTIDVYRRTITPTKDPIAFFAYISFFPQLVAGPIERATNLLPQFLRERSFNYPLAVEGSRQMLWGFFKKVLVADTAALIANTLLESKYPTGITIWVAMTMFAIQIYGDFSGYSEIAIGCSKLFGFKLMKNFDHPYFARDIAEFWRRWHISLTTWFRDYIYIPLGGSRCSTLKKIRNTFVIFLVSGLWHGANWTFVMWGIFHAVCFIPLLVLGKNRRYVTVCVAQGKMIPNFKECLQMLSTFFLVVVGWTFFRATNISEAFCWIKGMFTNLTYSIAQVSILFQPRIVLPLILGIAIDWFNREREIPRIPQNPLLRNAIYLAVIVLIIFLHQEPQTFIYFQF